MRSPQRLLTFVSIFALALGVAACASESPPKQEKPKRTILSSDYDDARLGKEASVDVKSQIGVLDDPELNAYIDRIGKKLLRGVPRRGFKYEFYVVDQVEPNAFALPGGYIFLSRGLLALANNEDEVACVMGHEITHAAHRHAAAQQVLASGGNPLASPWARQAQLASYGRDMERDADKGGQILCAAAGYDPLAMSTLLTSLGQAERLRAGFSRMPSFFDTHPGSQERAAVNRVRASELRWKRDPTLGDTQKSLFRHIEGLPVGQRPEAGMFIGHRFVHPDMNFQVSFPSGWELANTNAAVGASAPRGDAVVFLEADMPKGNAQEMAERWLATTQEQHRLATEESKPVKVGPLDSWRMQLTSGGSATAVTLNVTFIPYGDLTWRITGASPSRSAKQYVGRTLATVRSFRPLTAKERASLKATKLHIVAARPGEGFVKLGQRTGDVWNPTEAAIYNGQFSNHRYAGGELVKIARETPYVPKEK